jgi:hypothetical protein
MDDKATLTKRLNGLAEVLTETTNFSSYAHTVYEAGAELDRQAKQIAMLREALATMLHIEGSGMAVMGWGAAIVKAHKALAATAEDQGAWEKSKRDAVLEEAVIACDEYWFGGTSAGAIRALKDKP